MLRDANIRRHFSREMKLVEIGASYSPILPKADGWNTTVVDHAGQADLVAKYNSMGVATIDRIEPVDYVWRDGPLTALIPEELHESFDGLVASHVGEHFPDFIGFLNGASTLLKPSGVMALALPDKRACFDFFQPLSTAGDMIAAHLEGRTRHQHRIFFNQAAYSVFRGGKGGWAHAGDAGDFGLANPLSQAHLTLTEASGDPDAPYRDSHAWVFTPQSFELLMLELNLLGYTDWAVRKIEPAAGVEFYVWLERRRLEMPAEEINPRRLSLMAGMVTETKSAIAQLEAAGAAPPEPEPEPAPVSPTSICTIIALYNGGAYIEQTLNSVFRQTLPPDEIIVVDDGSTDGGAGVAIVERLAQTRNLTLLRKTNGGQSSARNLGVRHARSALIAFLDQDDIWYDHHLEQLVKPFTEPSSTPLGWVYSDIDEVDEHGFMVARCYLSTLSTAHPKRNISDCIRQDMFILPSASLICRKAFEASGCFDERLCGYEDDDLFMRMFRLGYGNIFVEDALSQWRIYQGSTSYSYRMAISRKIYIQKLLETFPDQSDRARFHARDMIAHRFYDIAVRDCETALKRHELGTLEAAWGEIMVLIKLNDDIARRLLQRMLRLYRGALIEGDKTSIAAVWQFVFELSAVVPDTSRRMRLTLALLRNPRLAQMLFRVRLAARPMMLWAFAT